MHTYDITGLMLFLVTMAVVTTWGNAENAKSGV